MEVCLQYKVGVTMVNKNGVFIVLLKCLDFYFTYPNKVLTFNVHFIKCCFAILNISHSYLDFIFTHNSYGLCMKYAS